MDKFNKIDELFSSKQLSKTPLLNSINKHMFENEKMKKDNLNHFVDPQPNIYPQNNLNHILTYDKAWAERLGKRHEIFGRIKDTIYNLSDEKYNSIAHAISKVPMQKRSLGNVFKIALFNKPSLLIDIAKVFLIK